MVYKDVGGERENGLFHELQLNFQTIYFIYPSPSANDMDTDVRRVKCIYLRHFFHSGLDREKFSGFKVVRSLDELKEMEVANLLSVSAERGIRYTFLPAARMQERSLVSRLRQGDAVVVDPELCVEGSYLADRDKLTVIHAVRDAPAKEFTSKSLVQGNGVLYTVDYHLHFPGNLDIPRLYSDLQCRKNGSSQPSWTRYHGFRF